MRPSSLFFALLTDFSSLKDYTQMNSRHKKIVFRDLPNLPWRLHGYSDKYQYIENSEGGIIATIHPFFDKDKNLVDILQESQAIVSAVNSMAKGENADCSAIRNAPWNVQYPENAQVACGTWHVVDAKGRVVASLYRQRNPSTDTVTDGKLQAHAIVQAVNAMYQKG